MWPVMTLTLLLQLTDEEQLFASRNTPVVEPQEQLKEVRPTTAVDDAIAQWPVALREEC